MTAVRFDPETQRILCSGEWNLPNISELELALSQINWPEAKASITIDGKDLARLDTAGAWLIVQIQKKLTELAVHFELTQFANPQLSLIKLVASKLKNPLTLPEPHVLTGLALYGSMTINQLKELKDFLSFTGDMAITAFQGLWQPARWRLRALAHTIQLCGAEALFIIAILSLMIGVVITYQMGLQLKSYGANIYIVDLLGLAILREFAPLITAIMIAGRTGSAFTAQLGSMKINYEIDVLNTMGIKPAGLLVLPRVLGLAIALPLLTIWADCFGIFGGMMMSNNMLDVTWYHFLHRFQSVVSLRSLVIGLGKAPVFALIIASIGCFEGMKVGGSADSVGKQTTKSVVLAIFCIMIADALFSILLSKLHL